MSNEKKLKVYSLISDPKKKVLWEKQVEYWNKYFIMDHQWDGKENIQKIAATKPVDILFLDEDDYLDFEFNFYQLFKNANIRFIYIVVKNIRDENDGTLLKNLVDDIVHLDVDERSLKWKTTAILRRYWSTYSKQTTIIYKDIIADFVDNIIILNGRKIEFTNKEIKLLRYFLENKGKYLDRNKIFEDVWGYTTEDNTRTVDQILHKIKKKIGDSYFITKRKSGIKFE